MAITGEISREERRHGWRDVAETERMRCRGRGKTHLSIYNSADSFQRQLKERERESVQEKKQKRKKEREREIRCEGRKDRKLKREEEGAPRQITCQPL